MHHRSTLFAAVLLCLHVLHPPTAHAISIIHVPADQPTIQAGIDAAIPGDTVLVAPGTYFEHVDFKGKAITVTSSDGAAKTIIDGGGTGPAVYIGSTPPTNSTDPHTPGTLSGFTVQHGFSPPVSDQVHPAYNDGGGVDIIGDANVLNNIITNNTSCAVDVLDGSAVLIQGNVISNSTPAQTAGAECRVNAFGIFVHASNYGSNIQILNNVVEANQDGGIYVSYTGTALIASNTVRNNGANVFSAFGISLYSGIAIVLQNVIYSNAGVGIDIFGSATVANNTVVGNGSQPNFNSIATQLQISENVNSNDIKIVNNLLFGSGPLPAAGCSTVSSTFSGTLPSVWDHNDIFDSQPVMPAPRTQPCQNAAGTFGNIAADPQFVNPANNDFHLRQGSPAIDTGNTSILASLAAIGITLPTDFDNHPRLEDATRKGYPVIDMGAYEFAGQQDASATTILLTPSAFETPGGSNITLAAKLLSAAGTPTGPVTFSEDGNILGSATIEATGDATLPTSALVPGIHAFLATYAGQGPFTPATSVHIYVLVDKFPVTLTLTATPNPIIVNQTATFTATISSPDHTIPSPITINDSIYTPVTLTPDANGHATYTASFPNIGAEGITATYSGDDTHASASAFLSEVIVSGYTTSTTLTSTQNPAAAGQPVTFNIAVANTFSQGGPPTGAVTLTDGNTVLATLPLLPGAPVVTYTTSTLPIGSHTITATYNPTGGFAGSSASLTETITGQFTSLSLTATPNPVSALAPLTLTASLTYLIPAGINPTGTVTFFDGSIPLGTSPLTNTGRATLTTSLDGARDHILHASYSGDSVLAPSTSPIVTETVTLNPTSTSLTVTPAPNATAFQTITLNASTHSPSTASVATPLCLGCAIPAITFFANGSVLGSAPVDSAGNAHRTFNLPAGSFSLTATYLATPSFAESTSNPVAETIAPATPNLTLTAQPNPALQSQPVTLTASLATPGIPPSAISGNVTFLDAASPLGTAPIGNFGAVLNVSTLFVGTHQISAVYSGNANLTGASAALSVTILPQDFTLTTNAPTLTIQTKHHAPMQVTITTIGALADTIHLSCPSLPQYASCTFSPNDLTTSTDPTVTRTSTVTIDTDFLLNYARTQRPQPTALPRALTLALLAPITLLGIASRRRQLPRLLLAALLLATVALSANGCSGKLPGHTPPGTYTVPITGQARASGITHTATLTLTVTE